MSVQVDIEGRKITATVADLVDLPERRDWVRGVSQAARARLGIRAHTRYRSQRAAQYDSFRAEVPVVLQRQVDGFAATVGGRVDGWLSEGATTVLEEAKSVALTGDELAAVELDQISAFAFQLRLYGLAVRQQQPGHPLTARLVLLSLLDGEQRTVAVPLQPQATRRGLDARLREAIGQSHAAAERRARLARCAEALRFPYARLRDGQQPLLDTIQDGLESFRPVLAQAATGTGKTVCALLAALRFSLPRAAPVWFVTAKNTQQQLAAETFLDLCRRASLSAADLNAVTVRAKLAMCPPEHRLCHPDLCPYLHRFDERLAESELLDDLLEHHLHLAPDLIYQRSATCSLCPFEVTLALTGRAQLVIADYNYLYDGPPQPDRRAVVIIDEAHNLVDRARASLSPFIASAELAELSRCSSRGELCAPGDSPRQLSLCPEHLGEQGGTLFSELERLCAELHDEVARWLDEASAGELPTEDSCSLVDLDVDRWTRRRDQVSRWLLRYGAYQRANRIVRPRDPAVELLRQVDQICGAVAGRHPELAAYVAGDAASAGPGVGLVCLDPAPWLLRHHREALGTVAMSATLQPADYYLASLGLESLEPLSLATPSPFPEEHRCVAVVPTVTTTYRQRGQHARRIAELIEEVVAARSGPYVAYFPSFPFLAAVQQHLRLRPEQVLVQQRTMPPRARTEILCQLRDRPHTTLLLAITGGVFAEGVDLPGRALIGAIVVGPALPPIGFERSLMRSYYDEQYGRGFAYAMLVPGMQRVVQAAGRVIRSMEDHGVIVLLGRRFATPEYAACLPAEWYRYDPSELCTDAPGPRLAAFWRQVERG